MLIVEHAGMGLGAAEERTETEGTFHCTRALPGPLHGVSGPAVLEEQGWLGAMPSVQLLLCLLLLSTQRGAEGRSRPYLGAAGGLARSS